MEYYINSEKVNLELFRPFDSGSEGKVYKIDDYVYKIYHQKVLDKDGVEKLLTHQRLLGINTNQILLPDALIYDAHFKYLGYRTPFIENKKTGITFMNSSKFIKNLRILENDLEILSKNKIIVSDFIPINYIYSSDDEKMYMIDPGKYKYGVLSSIEKYSEFNFRQYNLLISQLLVRDFVSSKLFNEKDRIKLLVQYIESMKSNISYSEFFSRVLKKYENVDEYAKSLGKYI